MPDRQFVSSDPSWSQPAATPGSSLTDEQIDQEVSRWKSLGLSTDELGRLTDGKGQPRQPTTLEQLAYNIKYPTPGMTLAADVATAMMGLFSPSGKAGTSAASGATQGVRSAAGSAATSVAKLPAAAVQYVDPDVVGMVSPRTAAAVRLAQRAVETPKTARPVSAPTADLGDAIAAARAARAARFGTEPAPAAPLTAEQLAAQSAVHNAPVAPEAPIPTQGMPDIRASSAGVDANARAATARAANPRMAAPSTDPAAELAARLGTPTELELVQQLVKKGVTPSTAVKTVAGQNQAKFGALMTAYLKAQQAR